MAFAKKTVNIADLAAQTALGESLQNLLAFGLRAMLIVPIISKDRVVGSLGLDVIDHQRTFSPNEIELCSSLANQVAIAFENARLLGETARRAEKLENLQRLLRNIAASLQVQRSTREDMPGCGGTLRRRP